MVGSAWQRCRVRFMRNVLAKMKRNNTHMVIAAIQTIFAQPDAASVRETLRNTTNPVCGPPAYLPKLPKRRIRGTTSGEALLAPMKCPKWMCGDVEPFGPNPVSSGRKSQLVPLPQ
jgi:Transposase, Mutator family